MILTPLQKLPNNVGDLGKIIVATGFEWLPKVQKIAQSGHTAWWAVHFSLPQNYMPNVLSFGPNNGYKVKYISSSVFYIARYPDVLKGCFTLCKSCIPSFTDCAKSRFSVRIQFATKKVKWPILNNSHAYPFCKTTPNGQY